MKKISLVVSFTIYSLITFLIIGVVLSVVISEHIKNDYQTNLYMDTQTTVDSITENILSERDFSNKIDNTKKVLIEENITNYLSLYMPRSYVLLNRKKEIILTNQQDKDDLSSDELNVIDKILKNKMSYYLSNGFSQNNERVTRVFNLYTPVKYKEDIIGVLLLQFPEAIISSHVNMLVREIVITMIGGLCILFLLLIRIICAASKTLRKQNNELIIKNEEIVLGYKKLSDSYKNTIMALSNAVDARDSYTAGHSERVTKISLLIAKQLALADEEMKKLEYAALFHDIGKIGIPDHILLKNSKLTEEEYAVIKKHPEMGVNILKSIEFLDDILPIIKHHHEQYSGNGYPDKMIGEEIPICSRIIAVADTYDAMTSDRPYRKRLPHQVAVNEILHNREIQFDGKIVDAFIVMEKNINYL